MKKRNLFMCTTIMCVLLSVAFTFKNNQITWLWKNNIPVAIILVLLAIYLAEKWKKFENVK